MVKKFKSKKKFTFNKSKTILYTILIVFVSIYTFYYIYHLKFASSNEEFITYLLEDANHFKEYNSSFKKTLYKMSRALSGMDTSKPVTLLENKFLYKSTKEAKPSIKGLAYQEEKQKKEETSETQKEDKPLIYIYSTHQTEGYAAGNLQDFNITPDVMMASYLLKDRLEKLGAHVIIEERRMSDYLKQNNLNYDYSYKASRYYLEDFMKSHSKIDLAIDLHRDALTKNLSTVTIDHKNYAKILFVLGGKARTYRDNLDVVNQLNGAIKTKYPTLTRGLLSREYSVYNQDLGNRMILLELGGNENTVDEVMNTVDALAPIFADFVGGKNGNG